MEAVGFSNAEDPLAMLLDGCKAEKAAKAESTARTIIAQLRFADGVRIRTSNSVTKNLREVRPG